MSEGNLGVHVTARSEVRVLPREQPDATRIFTEPSAFVAQRRMHHSAARTIDTTIEPMFHQACADVRTVRRRVPARGRNRRNAARLPEPQALSRLPCIPAFAAAAKTGPSTHEAPYLPRLQENVSGEAGDRREGALPLPTPVLSRLLAIRRAQHLKASSRCAHIGRAEACPSSEAARILPSVASQAAPEPKAFPGRRSRR